jgi:ribonuclease BN (tRNA processing enzyme)
MNIEFLGNGNITSNNFNASYLIDNHILVDAPAGMLKQLKENDHNIHDIDVIFITHMHGDHYFDLPFILLNEYAAKRENNLILIGPKTLKRKLRKLTKLAFPNSYKKILNELNLTYYNAESLYKTVITNINVSSVNVIHGPLKYCYGYIFEKDNKKIGFTGDTEMCPGLTYMVKNVNVCVVDVSKNGTRHHLKLDELKQLCEDNKIIFIPTHFPDSLRNDFKNIKNVKLINCHEQFYL